MDELKEIIACVFKATLGVIIGLAGVIIVIAATVFVTVYVWEVIVTSRF